MPTDSDNVYLEIGGKKIAHFDSYSIDSNLFVADDPFTLTFSSPDIEIKAGQQCRLFVNDEPELNGVIDNPGEAADKSSRTFTVSGRDLMGLLVDAYVEDFSGHEGIELKALAEGLLKNIPFINRQAIIYGKGNKARAAVITGKTEDFDIAQIEPGQTVFDALKGYGMSRGQIFYAAPAGTLVFGEPLTRGSAEYSLTRREDGIGNNIKKGTKQDDISGRYKTIRVIGQRQGSDDWAVGDHNVEGSAIDKDFPFEKTFVATLEHDGQDPDKYAAILMSKQIFEGFQLGYTVKGHSQKGRNWQANSICHVKDEVFKLDEDLLIYGRTFTRARNDGTETSLKLSKLGALPV